MPQHPLITVSVGGTSHTFEPADAPVTVGRESRNDVIVAHPSVSAEHATIEFAGGAWRLRDRSTHGTFVADERVSEVVVDGELSVLLADPVNGASMHLSVEVVADDAPMPLQRSSGSVPDLRISIDGRSLSFGRDDGPITVGRDATNDVVVTGDSVSGTHGSIEFVAGTWIYRDHSSYGSYVDDARITTQPINRTVRLRLADPNGTEILVESRVAEGLGGDVIRTPQGSTRPAPSGNVLRVTYPPDTTRDLHPGADLVIGRDADSSDAGLKTTPTNDLVSRRHARVAFDGTTWQIEDLKSGRGMFVDGVRVDKQKLTGNVIVWLGSPTTGERLVFEAKGVHKRRFATKTIVAAAATVVVLVGGAALLASVLSGSSDTTNLAGNDVTRMKLATGLVISWDDEGGYKGSSTVLCGDHLVLTNAHVAQPDAPGQGLLYGSAEDPATSPIYLAYPPPGDPDGIAEVRFRAEVVAFDGYVDAAALKIVGEASGQYPDIVDGAAIDDPASLDLACAELPESGVVPSKTAVDVFGYPGTTASDDSSRFFDVQLDADSNEITSFSEDTLLDARNGWINLGRDIQGGNSGGLLARNNQIFGIPTRGGANEATEISSQARPIDLARPVIEAARSGRNGDLADYLTPLAGTEAFELLQSDPGGCLIVSLDRTAEDQSADMTLTWTNVSETSHLQVLVSDTDERLLAREMIGRSPEGPGVLADTNCISFAAAPDNTRWIDVLGGPNLEVITSFDLGAGA